MNDKMLARELVKIAKMLMAITEDEINNPKPLTPEQKAKLDEITKKFKDFGDEFNKQTNNQLLEVLKLEAEIDQKMAAVKSFYMGDAKAKIDGWKKTSGYDDFKKDAIKTLQETMAVGQKLDFVANILSAQKKYSQAATPTKQLEILLSLSNKETVAKWEKAIAKIHSVNTEVVGLVTAMGIKAVDFTDEAKAAAAERGVELGSTRVAKFTLGDLFTGVIDAFKKLLDKGMNLIKGQKSDLKDLDADMDKLIDQLS